MKAYSSREIKRILEANGWYIDSIRGDHYQFKHVIKRGKNLPIKTVKSIFKQTGIETNL